MKGLQAVDAIERDEHEFKPSAPIWRRDPDVKLVERALGGNELIVPTFGDDGDTTYTDPPQPVPKLKRARLEEIADLVRTLTYGEMIDLAAEIWHFREVGEINSDTLPAILHGWAIQRGKSNGR